VAVAPGSLRRHRRLFEAVRREKRRLRRPLHGALQVRRRGRPGVGERRRGYKGFVGALFLADRTGSATAWPPDLHPYPLAIEGFDPSVLRAPPSNASRRTGRRSPFRRSHRRRRSSPTSSTTPTRRRLPAGATLPDLRRQGGPVARPGEPARGIPGGPRRDAAGRDDDRGENDPPGSERVCRSPLPGSFRDVPGLQRRRGDPVRAAPPGGEERSSRIRRPSGTATSSSVSARRGCTICAPRRSAARFPARDPGDGAGQPAGRGFPGEVTAPITISMTVLLALLAALPVLFSRSAGKSILFFAVFLPLPAGLSLAAYAQGTGSPWSSRRRRCPCRSSAP